MEFITSDMFLTFAGCLAITALVTQVIKSLPPLDKINTLWSTFGVSILVGVIRLFLIGDFTAQGITMGILNILAIYLGAIGGYETVKQITKK